MITGNLQSFGLLNTDLLDSLCTEKQLCASQLVLNLLLRSQAAPPPPLNHHHLPHAAEPGHLARFSLSCSILRFCMPYRVMVVKVDTSQHR